MLGFMFGFNMRLGRLHYLLALLGLGFALAIVCVPLAVGVKLIAPNRPDLLRWLIIIMLALLFWSSVMLQAMRFRDIGWDPVCMVPASIAMSIVDHTVATRIPEWSLMAAHPGTIVGALVNVALVLALLFWPGGASDDQTLDERGRGASSEAPRTAARPPSLTEARIARLTVRDAGGWRN